MKKFIKRAPGVINPGGITVSQGVSDFTGSADI
jgi:hypothetical protein